MKKPECSSSTHEASLQLKPDKILFRPIAASPEPAAAVPKRSPPLVAAEDLLDTNKALSEQWVTLCAQFPDIGKFDHKSITNYGNNEEESVKESRCERASRFLELVVSTLAKDAASISGKTVKDDLIKIYVVTFQRVTYSLLSLVLAANEDPSQSPPQPQQTLDELMGRRAVLNDFLLLIMQDRKNSPLLSQQDVSLMQIVRESVNQLHERLANVPKSPNARNVAYFLYYQFQTLAMLSAFNESRSFMKTAASDCIRLAFETLERSLRASMGSAALKEAYTLPIDGHETWMVDQQPHVKIAVQFGKKKLALVQLGAGSASPLFSLRYIAIYYALKITQMMISRKIFTFEERTLETIAIVLKDTAELLGQALISPPKELTRVEIALNEDLACFNVIKRILPSGDDPFAILEKLGYTRLIKELVGIHLATALKLGLVAPAELKSEPVSYKRVHDYVAGVFNFVSRLRDIKSSKLSKIATKTTKASIGNLAEEVFGEIIGTIDTMSAAESSLLVLKTYVVEHLFNCKNVVSRQTAEHLIRLIESKAFHFTSPNTFAELDPAAPGKENKLNKTNNRRIVTLLNEVVAYDKNWAETILGHMMGQIKPLYSREEQLFGLYKLIYCAVANEVHDNASFSSKFLINTAPVARPTRATYTEYESRSENKAVQAFLDIKGVDQLFEILQVTYKAMLLEPGRAIQPFSAAARMTEQLFLNLNSIPAVAEQVLLKSPGIATEFLEFFALGEHVQTVVVSFMQRLLAAIKYSGNSAKFQASPDIRNAYFPLRLLDFVRSQPRERTVPLLELLVNFVAPEAGVRSLEQIQSVMMGSQALDTFFSVVRSPGPSAGIVLELFVRFLGGLQFHNDTVAIQIAGSPVLAKKELYQFIKGEIVQVASIV